MLSSDVANAFGKTYSIIVRDFSVYNTALDTANASSFITARIKTSPFKQTVMKELAYLATAPLNISDLERKRKSGLAWLMSGVGGERPRLRRTVCVAVDTGSRVTLGTRPAT